MVNTLQRNRPPDVPGWLAVWLGFGVLKGLGRFNTKPCFAGAALARAAIAAENHVCFAWLQMALAE
jgi:hypothetical protein